MGSGGDDWDSWSGLRRQGIQEFSHFAGQGAQSEGFLKERGAMIRIREVVVGVAGKIEDSQVRA